MKPQRIGVVMGGSSSEREVSLRSGRAVAAALSERGHDVVRLELGATTDALRALTDAKVDLAFLALHGRGGEDGCVQGLLELAGIPYTGSSVLASALAMDKLKAKELFRLHNVPTPPYYPIESSVSEEELADVHGSFGYPVIVKPRSEGSSFGVRRASNHAELVEAVRAARELDSSVLVERFIRGQEITVALLDGRVLGALEIETKSGVYDYASKYTAGATEYHMPARLSPVLHKNVLNLAERAASALGVTGAVRVDLIVSEGHNEYVLGVNTLPGLSSTSLLPRIAQEAGFEFADLCEAIAAGARLSFGKPKQARSSVAAPRAQVTARPELRLATG